MKITFKDVGQGDSIILEWEDGGIQKVGLIDCQKKGRRNPVVEHLEHLGVNEIEFIILSHPHSDHFSGMVQLLDYLADKKILVKKFAHTLFILGHDFYKYLNWVEIDSAALFELQQIVEKVNSLRSAGVILKMVSIIEGWREELTSNTYLKCLSPSQLEAEQFMAIVSGEPEKNRRAASKGANYLSTLFCLVSGEKYSLLTSDTEAYSFDRIHRELGHPELLKKSLDVGQLPHHGSWKNYYKPFWDHISKNELPCAVVSSGFNEKYKHPHFLTLKSFFDDGFQIYCTNVVHGSKEFLEHLKRVALTNSKLDTFSTLIDSFSSGDKVFPSG